MSPMREITSLDPYSGPPVRGSATQHQPCPCEGSELGDGANAEGKHVLPKDRPN